MVAVSWSSACGTLQGLAGCKGDAGESPAPSMPSIRTIQLDQRWTGERGSLCFYEIRIYDGGFLVLGHTVGEPSPADPWHAALRGLSSLLLTDERDRLYGIGMTDGRAGHITALRVDGLLPPTPRSTGDLLNGVHQLTFRVDNVLGQVDGPWTFENIPARSGPLSAMATAAGRELRLFDLLVKPDGFSVGFMELGSHFPPFVGIRSPYNEFAPARDDKGNTYAVVAPERIGGSAVLYMKFAPAPPSDAKLTITLNRIFVSTDRSWRGSLYLP